MVDFPSSFFPFFFGLKLFEGGILGHEGAGKNAGARGSLGDLIRGLGGDIDFFCVFF